MGIFNKKEKLPYWTRETHLFKSDVYICSACGHKEKKALKVCPGCGRTMTGTKYDPSWVDEMEMMDIIFGDD